MDSRIQDAHDTAFEEVDLADDGGEFFGGDRGPRIEFRDGGGVGFGGLTAEEFGDEGGGLFAGEESSESELEAGKSVVADGVNQSFLVGVAVFGLGFGAGELEDFAVLDAGGAGGFTGPAAEAGIEGLVGRF